jgi:CrcB protein
MLRALLFVGLGGAIGSMARYGIGVIMDKYISHTYPFATFLVNIVGCFIIGLLFGFGEKNGLIPGTWWLVLATGFCGGFTTFSTLALENVNLSKQGNITTATVYTLLSVVLGFLLCRWGISLARH